MKYDLYSNNDLSNIKNTILLNRNIDNPEQYLNTTDDDIIHYSKLKNIDEAIKIFNRAIEDKIGIFLIPDSDFDGMCASSILYQYIKENYNIECGYYMHSGKEHGISKDILPQIISDIKNKKLGLLIVADAATSDEKVLKEITSLGCKVITLDHHEVSSENEYSCLVNPLISEDYKNKNLSGCGVTWKFLQALDDENWTNNSDKYIDLVATSIISDSMSILNFENKRLIEKGLSSINNNFLKALIEKQSYSMKSEVTPTTIAFYIVPLINGLIRSGEQEEKELMFKAFCQKTEFFKYTKRDKTIVDETIYEKVARSCVNAKSRQDRAIDKGIEIVEKDIELNNRNNNKILFALVGDEIEKNFSGLVAMKLASKYNKPCVLLRENANDYFSGSIRNFNGSPLTGLKSFLQSLGYVQWIQGHESAAGIGLTKKQLIKTIELSNEKLANYDFSPIYHIDFSITPNKLNHYILTDLHSMRFHYGQQIPEALILLENVSIKSSDIQFIGKEIKDTWKFVLKDNIDVIKFKNKENDYITNKYRDCVAWDADNIEMNMIVKISQNMFNDELRWCLIVEDYELLLDK